MDVMKSTYLNRDMCKFESSQKDESRWQLTDSLKAYRNTSAFKCCYGWISQYAAWSIFNAAWSTSWERCI